MEEVIKVNYEQELRGASFFVDQFHYMFVFSAPPCAH
jgi:hypothetical protein